MEASIATFLPKSCMSDSYSSQREETYRLHLVVFHRAGGMLAEQPSEAWDQRKFYTQQADPVDVFEPTFDTHDEFRLL